MTQIAKIRPSKCIVLEDSQSGSDIDQCQSNVGTFGSLPKVSIKDQMTSYQIQQIKRPNMIEIRSEDQNKDMIENGSYRSQDQGQFSDEQQQGESYRQHYTLQYRQHDKMEQEEALSREKQCSKEEDELQDSSYIQGIRRIEEQAENSQSLMMQQEQNEEMFKRLRRNNMPYIGKQSKAVKLEQKQQVDQTVCSICIGDITQKSAEELGRLKCRHVFCIQCIQQSSKFVNKCPYCRARYNQINHGGVLILVEDKQLEQEEIVEIDEEPCYVCHENVDYDFLLVCDSCDRNCCHTYCDQRLQNLQSEQVPEGNWYCHQCSRRMGR